MICLRFSGDGELHRLPHQAADRKLRMSTFGILRNFGSMKSSAFWLATFALLGIVLGVGITWAELGSYFQLPPGIGLEVSDRQSALTDAVKKKPLPRAMIVNGHDYDFGTMERDTHRSHAFEFRNDGEAPLTLIQRGTTCKCTLSDIEHSKLAPGQSTTVKLEWTAIANEGQFRQSATIETNDPRRQFVTLTVSGKVTYSHRVSPTELVFTTLSAREPTSAELLVYSFHPNELKIEHSLMDSVTAAYFDVSTAPMSDEQVAHEEGAKTGKIVKLTIKPGLPLGELRQNLRLRLDLPGKPLVEVPIAGRVTGDISIVGPQLWDADNNILTIGKVNSIEGYRSHGLYLLIKGTAADKLALTPGRISPEFLQLEFAPIQRVSSSVAKVPFTVAVPAGTPPANHSGSILGKMGQIEIVAGESDGQRIKFFVQFEVEK